MPAKNEEVKNETVAKTSNEIAEKFYEKKQPAEKKEVAPVKTEVEAADDKATDEVVETPEVKAKDEVKDEVKPEDAGAEKAPEKYDLKIPEGSKLKVTATERIARIAREQGLTNSEAQQLLVQEHEAVSVYEKEQNEELSRTKANWKKELETDPDVGGAKLKENSEDVRRGLEANFSKETIAFIDTLELGNNKHLFKDLLKLGRKLKDDKIDSGKKNTSTTRKSVEEVFYGATK